MSAVAAWAVGAEPHTAGPVVRGRERHLALVAPPVRPRTVGRIRLTRRGRLLRTLLVFGLLGWFALGRWVPLGPAPLGVQHTTVVRPGQTLSHIARAELPGLPVKDAVVRIQMVNGLSSTDIMPGQALAIPGE